MLALIAHDKKKELLRTFVASNMAFFGRHNVLATDGTADELRTLGCRHVDKAGHGPEGGDMVIGSHIVRGDIEAVFFFRDPLSAHPHEHDVSALLRICDVHNIPLATNLASAQLLIKALS